ncbi:MerR family transcriptional regulator [Paenibacillus sp. URB8-2]|uniref:MerR family transcriptional regulator n=1 Tax=Paenibacillus sp. URB8-2 TaxID=2741301 RepID=UPI0015BB0A60|nr:MerR family transcriptional regulator [Paenibacillus sp. URB8-2]BCG58499.1 MerR family transcriptional regulator [Paenibacillus sp. URB8-2]
MKIKEVAERLGLSARAIRFYEEKGLIAPSKGDNQYREFSEQEVWRLQTVIALREAGMSVEDIRRALQEWEGRDHERLQYYLELQRSALFAKWLEIKSMIETADSMIEMVKKERSLQLDDLYALAEASRKLRGSRNWEDKWNYDRRAVLHDRNVRSAAEYEGYEEALELAVEWLAPAPGEKGLDIGTGTGNLAGKLMERSADMTGVDQSKEMLKQCGLKYPQLKTKLGNFLALPFIDEKFDFAVSSFAFHHLAGEQQTLAVKEMRRVLKPHGRICIADLMLAEGDHAPMPEEDGYPSLSGLLAWFEDNGYITKHRRIKGRLHLVFAVPIR